MVFVICYTYLQASCPPAPVGTIGQGAKDLKRMFYVYVLYSEFFERYYIGMSENVDRRLSEHNSGKVISTKPYKPWIIVHKESFDTRYEARDREKYLKTAAGRRWRKKHIRPRGATE